MSHSQNVASFNPHPEFLSDLDHDTVTAVRSMLSNSENADIMVNSLIRKVELDPNNYQIF